MTGIRLADEYREVRFLCEGDGTHARHWTRPQLRYVQRDSAGVLWFSMDVQTWIGCQGVLEGDDVVTVSPQKADDDPPIPDDPADNALGAATS